MTVLRFAAKPVALSRDRDDLGVMQEAIQDGRGAGNVTDQFAPIFKRSIARHHSAAGLITPHDDLEEVLAASLRQQMISL